MTFLPASVEDLQPRHAGTLDRIEWLFAVVAILFMTGGLTRLLSGSLPEDVARHSASPVVQLTALMVYAGALLFLAARLSLYWPGIVRNLLLFAPVLFAVATTFWSPLPDITLRRSVALFGTTALGMYLALRFDVREIANLLFGCLFLIILGSFLAALLLPGFGVHRGTDIETALHAGLWRGLYWHKNILGPAACILVIVTLTLWRSIPWSRSAKVAALVISTIVVFRSGSAQAIIQLVALGPLILAHRWFVRLSPMARLAIIVGGCVVAFPAFVFRHEFQSFLLGLIGRDATLSSRTYIWHAAVIGGMQHPYFGNGYEMGWNGPAGVAAMQFYYIDSGQAHNGYLQLWLDVGFVGLALLGPVLLVYLTRCMRVARISKEVFLLGFYFLLFHLSSNYVYSILMPYQSMYWMMISMLFVLSYKIIAEDRERAVAARLPGGPT